MNDPSKAPGATERPHDEHDDAASGTWRRFEQFVPEVVKKGLITGIGALFMTEEGVRSAISDLKLPKEAVAYLVGQAERSKRELTQTMARELRAFLDDVDITGVLQRVLAGMTVEFRTEVRFVPNETGLAPQVTFHEDHRPASEEPPEAPASSKPAKTAKRPKRSTAKKKKPSAARSGTRTDEE